MDFVDNTDGTENPHKIINILWKERRESDRNH